MIGTIDRDAAWRELVRPDRTPPIHTGEVPSGLPGAAERLLGRVLGAGASLSPVVLLEMEGEIKLKGWMPFRARQVLRAGEGFVWEAAVGKLPVRFRGGDALWRGRGSLDFRLWGIVPVARAAGPDVDRSAAGRLAAETVAWLPQALLPSAGCRWQEGDDTSATASIPVGTDALDVTVTVDDEGLLTELVTRRWGDPDSTGVHRALPFGGAVDAYLDIDGVTIAASGRVGWWWGSDRQADGEFFRYRITDGRFPG